MKMATAEVPLGVVCSAQGDWFVLEILFGLGLLQVEFQTQVDWQGRRAEA